MSELGVCNREIVRELLIEADDALTALAKDLDGRWEELTGNGNGWDPDAYFTPLENRLHALAEYFRFDYNEDIAKEAYRRRKLAEGPQLEAVE